MNELDLNLFEIDKSADEDFNHATYNWLRSLMDNYPNDVEITWRFARASYKYFTNTNDLDEKRAIIREGIVASEKLLHRRHAELYKWYAILVGVDADFQPISQRIKNGYVFKDHILKALEVQPDDSELHYLLGRFKYEAASLPWVHKKIAATLFGEPPSSTFEEAVDSFQKAEELANRPNLENRLFLSKSFVALNNYKSAVLWLQKILEVPARTAEDSNVHSEAKKLLDKYTVLHP